MDDIRPPQRSSSRYSRVATARPYAQRGGAVYRPTQHPAQTAAPARAPQVAVPAVKPQNVRPKLVSLQIRSKRLTALNKRLKTTKRYTKKALYEAKKIAAVATPTRLHRAGLALIAVVMLVTTFMPVVEPYVSYKTYALSSGESSLLQPTNDGMAKQVTFDSQNSVFEFNKNYTFNPDDKGEGGAKVTAKIYQDSSKGISLTDPVSQSTFTITPDFSAGDGKQQENRIVFPAFNGGGHIVYTLTATGIKQDVTLDHFIGNTLSYKYKLGLDDSYAAHIESDGSVGIYGSSLPLDGNVSTGSAKDAALLKKARQKAPKDKKLFTLPAPVVYEKGRVKSAVEARFALKGSELTVQVDNLGKASYPLTIDPTITAQSATDYYFDGTLDTNIDINTSANQFARGALTGGNLTQWSTSTSMQLAHAFGAAVVYGGTLYVIGGTSGTSTTNIAGNNQYMIEQAPINANGTLGSFSAGNATNLPSGGLSRFQLLVYNGYMYIIDGSLNDTTGTSISNAIYYTRVTSESYTSSSGSQLLNWNVTTTNTPATARYDYGATVYNGVLYIAGGRTSNAYNSATADVSYAQILPNGTPGSWTGTYALSTAAYGLDLQAYYGHIYALGGNQNGTLTANVFYNTIGPNGALVTSTWKQTNSLVSSTGSGVQAMENFGTQFSMVSNGYMYVTGGCTSVPSATSMYCNAVASYSQLAQINADGSLGSWYPNNASTVSGGSGTLTRTATPTTSFDSALYSLGGCSSMTANNACSTTNLSTSYAFVGSNAPTGTVTGATVGEISSKRTPTSLTTGNLAQPLFGQSSVVLNGYLYVIGGCIINGAASPYTCSSASTGRTMNYFTYYNKIAADGSLNSTWSTNTVATSALALGFDKNSGDSNCSNSFNDYCGLGGAAVVTYNGYIYVIGGNNGNTSTTAGYNNAVYYMKPSVSTGAPVAWTKSGNTINRAVSGLAGIAYNGSLYIIGGCYGTTGIGCSNYETQVQRSVIAADGSIGAWTTVAGGTQLQIATNLGIAAFGIAMYGNYIYLTGGAGNYTPAQGGTGSYGNVGQSTDVWRAKINASGNIVNVNTGNPTGGWTLTTAHLTQARRRGVAQAVNGFLYVIAGHNAADTSGGTNGTTYGDIQIGKIDTSSAGTGDVTGLSTSPTQFVASPSTTITPRWNPSIAFSNGFMYVLGGCSTGYPPTNCSTGTNNGATNESFVVYNANNFGANTWNNQANTYSSASNDKFWGAAAVYNGYIYSAGGCTLGSGTDCSLGTNSTAYAQISADGSIGTWTAGPSLVNSTAGAQLAALNGYLYYIGGQTGGGGSSVTTVSRSIIGSNGLPAAFSTTGQTQFPVNISLAGMAIYAGRIYVAGGWNGSANSNAVYYSTIDTNGNITAWTSTTAYSGTARREVSLVTAGAYLYLIGGWDGTNGYANVQVATPNTSTGVIANWTSVKELPYATSGQSAVAANGYIYMFGGRASGSFTNTTYYAAVNGNGTLGDWQLSPNTFTTPRTGAASVYTQGYFYVMGGYGSQGAITASNSNDVIQQSGQLSQAIHATYSRYIDYGTDATFRQFYMLGQNAQIGGVDIDKWNVIVKTSTAANNAWGQKTYYTPSTLTNGPDYGTALNFTPLDASGVNQGVAEYWQITFDIDQSQSFNFPDGNQPYIGKYDFFFSPGPAKRLRNGKTFVNNLQTTLDAHP